MSRLKNKRLRYAQVDIGSLHLANHAFHTREHNADRLAKYQTEGEPAHFAKITDNGEFGDGCYLIIQETCKDGEEVLQAIIPDDAIAMWIAALQAVANLRRASGYPIDGPCDDA